MLSQCFLKVYEDNEVQLKNERPVMKPTSLQKVAVKNFTVLDGRCIFKSS